MASKHYIQRFHCDPELECYCGSGKPFGQCCAAQAPDRPPPVGIHVVHDFIPPQDCRRLVRYAEKQKGHWLMGRDPEKSSKDKLVQKRIAGRITQQVDMSKHQKFINESVRNGLVQHAQRRFGPMESFEIPYLLRYKIGGRYDKHADAERYDEEARLWYRSADRDVSLLIYLNDDFEGGELNFSRLNYTYRPRAGDVVMFPSGNLFLHQAMEVTRGTKYALVTWAALKATPKLFRGATRNPPIRI